MTFLEWLSDLFKGLSDLQLGDEKDTLSHLVISTLSRDEEANNWSTSIPPVLNSGTVGGAATLETNWDDSLEFSAEHFRSTTSSIGKTCKALQQKQIDH